LPVPRVVASLLLGVMLAAPATAAEIRRAPEISLRDLNGTKVKLDYGSSRLTLVNFWATWCLPCREEMPLIAKLVEAHRGNGLRAVGVAMESGGAAGVRKFLGQNRDLGVNYDILLGNDGVQEKFGGFESVPTTLLIDSSGVILKTYVGITSNFERIVGEEIAQRLGSSGGSQTAPAAKP